ncbi:dynein light chain roadblock-type 1-like isoform X1 [Symsagittifera roscoffensis]|uniref:dynein light chain roadblock-type 1-like isoform X1 n=1 Tax=Symsagittifera roscoffensis TaxID=84072 RepID=UPI00307C3E98
MTQTASAIFERIKNHPGVLGIMVVNAQGYPIKSSMDNPTTMRYIESLGGVLYSANNLVRDLEPENEMQNIRISAEKDCSTQDMSTGAKKKMVKITEIMISPHENQALVVIQERVKNKTKNKKLVPIYDNYI